MERAFWEILLQDTYFAVQPEMNDMRKLKCAHAGENQWV